MGIASYVLGVKIVRDLSKRLLSFSQETYIKKLLERNLYLLPIEKQCGPMIWVKERRCQEFPIPAQSEA